GTTTPGSLWTEKTSPGMKDTSMSPETTTAIAMTRPLPTEALQMPTPPQTSEMIRQASPVGAIQEMLSDPTVVATAREELGAVQTVRPVLSDADLQAPNLPALPESVVAMTPWPEDAQAEETD